MVESHHLERIPILGNRMNIPLPSSLQKIYLDTPQNKTDRMLPNSDLEGA